MHSGNLVSGVLGRARYIFDIFGDSVNTASRMESHGEPGRIHCSSGYMDQAKDKFVFAPRPEKIEVKGKGLMQTYFLAE